MCETRDLGIKWPHWHTLVDMMLVFPQDVRTMLKTQARTTNWRKWAATQLQEGVWFDLIKAMQRKKIQE